MSENFGDMQDLLRIYNPDVMSQFQQRFAARQRGNGNRLGYDNFNMPLMDDIAPPVQPSEEELRKAEEERLNKLRNDDRIRRNYLLSIIIKLCSENRRDQILMVTRQNPDLSINHNTEMVFRTVICVLNNLDLGLWLLDNYPSIKVDLVADIIFRSSCENGYQNTLEWIIDRCQNINVAACKNYALKAALENSHFDAIEYVLNKFPDYDVHFEDDYMFRMSCVSGYLDFAKWIVATYPDTNVNADNDYAFRFTCASGHMAVLQWLTSTFKIDVNVNDGIAFDWACANGRLDVAKWLYENYGNKINFLADNFNALRSSALNGHKNIIEWLLDTFPDQLNTINASSAFVALCTGDDMYTVLWFYNKYNDHLDITFGNHQALRYALHFARMDLLKWLLSAFPELDKTVREEYKNKINQR